MLHQTRIALLTALVATTALTVACSKDATGGLEKSQIGIVGGQSALDNDSEEAKLVTASTVALVRVFPNGKLLQACTGTLIARDLILAASHCDEFFPQLELRAMFGADLGSRTGTTNIIKIKKFRQNPKYSPVTERSEDIAVLKLERPAPAAFKPVPILEDSHVLEPGEKLLLAGFGRMDDGSSEAALQAKSLQYVYTPLAFFEPQLVIVDQRHGTGACAGDSGGPAYVKRGNQLYVIGAVRGPYGEAKFCNELGEFTDATQFRKFLEDSANILNAEPPQFKSF